MIKKQVLTEWVTINGYNYPRVATDNNLLNYVDNTGQNNEAIKAGTIDPNSVIFTLFNLTETDSQNVDNDPNVFVIWTINQ